MASGRRLSNGLLTVYNAKNGLKYSRLGVSVGKSYGNAVARNRARRRLKEAFRRRQYELPALDIVCVVARNRLKRLMREAFRQNIEQIPAGFDYLLMISPRWPKKTNVGNPTKVPTFKQVCNSLLALVEGFLKNETRDTK